MKKHRILLVDDHALVREGIKNSLDTQQHMEVVGEARDGNEALQRLAQEEVDVVVMDVSMPLMGGAETTKRIIEKYPQVNVLVLSMYNEEARIREMLNAGALGYILKSTSMQELVEAIELVSKGESYFTQEVSAKIMNQLIKGRSDGQATAMSKLTTREVEILKLISEEFTNHEIADKLFISPRTVDTHRRNLIQKLQAKNTAGLVRFAIKNKIAEV
ncbi:response regulator [Roseivirga sp.]|uniref:response regulator n=1 Tax=Roseivirga sp. TaxID=1964215 RepID=UPI003B520A05